MESSNNSLSGRQPFPPRCLLSDMVSRGSAAGMPLPREGAGRAGGIRLGVLLNPVLVITITGNRFPHQQDPFLSDESDESDKSDASPPPPSLPGSPSGARSPSPPALPPQLSLRLSGIRRMPAP